MFSSLLEEHAMTDTKTGFVYGVCVARFLVHARMSFRSNCSRVFYRRVPKTGSAEERNRLACSWSAVWWSTNCNMDPIVIYMLHNLCKIPRKRRRCSAHTLNRVILERGVFHTLFHELKENNYKCLLCCQFSVFLISVFLFFVTWIPNNMSTRHATN